MQRVRYGDLQQGYSKEDQAIWIARSREAPDWPNRLGVAWKGLVREQKLAAAALSLRIGAVRVRVRVCCVA